jgi:protein gp37
MTTSRDSVIPSNQRNHRMMAKNHLNQLRKAKVNKTSIEWVKNPDGTQGYTWNPITGCLNGCPYCYARKLANGRLHTKYISNQYVAPPSEFGKLTDPFYPRFWEDRMDDPFLVDRNIFLKGQRRHSRQQRHIPRGIFVCDMGELFGDWLPRKWQEDIHLLISLNPQHRFYLLTKQPQNLIKFSPFPDNCWVGVTVTGNNYLLPALEGLDKIEAKIKYLSIEPFLEPFGEMNLKLLGQEYYRWYDWLIIGAQTKPYKPPKIEWVEEIELAAGKANIPIFEKNNLMPLLRRQLVQELPK